jgi:WD40 repeat protein
LASFSPNGRLLATAGTDGLALWDAATGGKVSMLVQNVEVRSMNWSSDGIYILAASSSVAKWNVGTGQGQHTLHAPADAVAWSGDGTQLATAAYGTPQTWDAESGEPRITHATAAKTVAFSPDGRRLAAGGVPPGDTTAGAVDIWTQATGRSC